MHIAIYLSNHDDKQQIIEAVKQGQCLELKGETIAVYSKARLQQLLAEEYRHERYIATASADRPLAQMSEGEQKKALLAAILQTRPAVLIVDDVFDSLDAASQEALQAQLQDIAQDSQIIQLFTRQRDRLAFIQRVYQWRSGALKPFVASQLTKVSLSGVIPEPYTPPVPLSDPLIAMRNLSVAYGDKKVIHSVDWTVNKGEYWQLIGPNGAGKSTLLRIINGDSSKGFGQDLYLFGQKKGSGESVWDIKKHIGYFTSSMVQNFSRYESVENMLLSGFFDSVGLYVKPQERHYRLARQWLSLIGLADKAKQAFHQLAIGHQRLVLVARAMVKHPPLLILDEPASGLDDTDIQRLVSLVNAFALTKRCAIIYVSHRKEEGLSATKTLQLIPSELGARTKIE